MVDQDEPETAILDSRSKDVTSASESDSIPICDRPVVCESTCSNVSQTEYATMPEKCDQNGSQNDHAVSAPSGIQKETPIEMDPAEDAVQEGQTGATTEETDVSAIARTASQKERATLLSRLKHAASTPNVRGLAPLLQPNLLGPGLKLRLQSIEENGFANPPAPEEIERWLSALRSSLGLPPDNVGVPKKENALEINSDNCKAPAEEKLDQSVVQSCIDAMPLPPGQASGSGVQQQYRQIREEAEQLVRSAISRTIPDALAARQLHRLSVVVSDTGLTNMEAKCARAPQQDRAEHERPAASRRKQSFLQVTHPEEQTIPTVARPSLRPSNGPRKQSFLHVTRPESPDTAAEIDDAQPPVPTQWSTSSTQPDQYGVTGDWQAGDSTEADFAMAVQDTLSVIREHRQYLDKSRAAARRNEDILTKLSVTPTASWRAKQKPSVGPYHATMNASATALPRSSTLSGPVRPASWSHRGRAATAMADRLTTKETSEEAPVVSSRSGVRGRRSSFSTGSLPSSRSSSMPPSQLSSLMGGINERLVDNVMKPPHAGKTAGQSQQHLISAALPRVEKQMTSEAVTGAKRTGRMLLDPTMPASSRLSSPKRKHSSSRFPRNAESEPSPVPRMSSARLRLRQSTFARVARPDPFAPKPDINTRISDNNKAHVKRSRRSSNDSSTLARNVLFEPSESRPLSLEDTSKIEESVIPRHASSHVPAWQRLSQQSTASWSSKGKAPLRGEEHQRAFRLMVDNRRNSMHSSPQAPSSARISYVGEDFDTKMEGSVRDRSIDAQRYTVDSSKMRQKLRQDSGASAEGPADADLTRSDHHTQNSGLIGGLDLAVPTEYDEEVVTSWHDDAGWLFSIADQKRLSEYEPLIESLRPVTARRSSSKLIVDLPSAETFQAMIDGAHGGIGRQPGSTGGGYGEPITPQRVPHLSRLPKESMSFMTRTKRFLLAPFKRGQRGKGSKPSGRPRRGSTGSLMARPALVPNMANGSNVVISHANSLRPGHNPALIRSAMTSGQSPSASRPRSGCTSKRPGRPLIRSPLATHEEETEEESGPSAAAANANMAGGVQELPVTDPRADGRYDASERKEASASVASPL